MKKLDKRRSYNNHLFSVYRKNIVFQINMNKEMPNKKEIVISIKYAVLCNI